MDLLVTQDVHALKHKKSPLDMRTIPRNGIVFATFKVHVGRTLRRANERFERSELSPVKLDCQVRPCSQSAPPDSEKSEVDFWPAEASQPIHPRSEFKKSDAFLRGNNKGTISVPEASPEFLCAPWNYVKSLA